MHKGTQGKAGCVCVCVCTSTCKKREKDERSSTNLMLKTKAKSFPGGISTLFSAVGGEVALVLQTSSVHSMGEMLQHTKPTQPFSAMLSPQQKGKAPAFQLLLCHAELSPGSLFPKHMMH